MGQAILYCFRCSTQLREVQFEQRKAFRIESWVCCAACAPEAVKTLPPDRAQALLKALLGAEKKPQTPSVPRRESTPRIPAAPSEPSKSSNKWILIGAGAAVGIGILLLVLFSGKPAPELPPDPPVAPRKLPPPPVIGGMTNPPPPPPPPPTTDSPERQAILKARKYAQEHPEDLEGQLREYNDLTLLADKTELGAEARKAVEILNARQRVAIDRGLATLETETAEALKRGDYGVVLKAIDAASPRVPGAQWKLALEKREREVREEIFKVFDGVKEKYREARAKGDAAVADALLARVKSWSLEKLSAELARIATDSETPPGQPRPRPTRRGATRRCSAPRDATSPPRRPISNAPDRA